MATRSAAKAHRQSLKRRLRNRAVKTATKTAVKTANDAIVGGDPEAARGSVREALAALDRAARKGVIHQNNAARRKSRLLLRYNAAVAAIQVTEPAPPKKPRATRSPRAATKPPAPKKPRK